MTLTQDGESTSLEFELPAYATDMIVTSVDLEKNTITTDWSGRTGDVRVPGTFNVAGKYNGNLGTLIGRTVNYGYDTDNNLTSFSLDDAEVIYGAMKFVNDSNDLTKAYVKDALTGETYKVNKSSVTAAKNLTWFYAAEDGDGFGTPVAGTTYDYVKLVLNPDGTISTANIVTALAQNLYVTEVDGTKVIQDKSHTFDLDGYIIVKDDKYIEPEDIELGDVVFINTTLKFADVYTNEISGEISNVISGKLDIDETTYNWDGAQYYDPDDDVYKTLSKDDDDEGAQAYLNSLDTEEDTTIYIARDKDIKYIDGTVIGQTKYTYETYLITKTAKTYQESLKNKFNVDVFDGTDTETVTIDLNQLKYYKGVEGKYEPTTENDWKDGAAGTTWNFTGKSKATYDVPGDVAPDTVLVQGSLVKFMYDSTGTIVGLSDTENAMVATLNATVNASSIDGTNKLSQTGSPNLKKGTSKLVQKLSDQTKDVYKMGDYTNLWIWNEKNSAAEGTNKDDTYTKVILTDFENEIVTNEAVNFEALSYRVDGTKVVDLVVKIKGNSAFATAETNTINGIMTASTKKNNSEDSSQVINTITIYGTDGKKVTYTADGDLADVTDAKNGDYVTLTQNKETELITAATRSGNWSAAAGRRGYIAADEDFSSEKLVVTVGNNKVDVTTVSGGVILLRYKEENSTKYKIVDYSDVNVLDGVVNVWYNLTNVNDAGDKVNSDMILVEQVATPEAVVGDITLVGDAVALKASGDNFLSSTANTKLTASFTGTLEDGVTIESWKWYFKANSTQAAEPVTSTTATPAGETTRELTLARVTNVGMSNTATGNIYYVVATASDGTVYTSPTVTVTKPVATSLTETSLSATYGTALAASNTSVVKDQFGEDITGNYSYSLTGTGNSGALTVGATSPGVAGVNNDKTITVTTNAATAAGTYAIKVYAQAAGTINANSVLVGTITLTVAPKAVAASDLDSAKLKLATAKRIATTDTLELTASAGKIDLADIDTISVKVGTEAAVSLGTPAALTGIALAGISDVVSDATAGSVIFTITTKGNFTGTLYATWADLATGTNSANTLTIATTEPTATPIA